MAKVYQKKTKISTKKKQKYVMCASCRQKIYGKRKKHK